MRSTIETNSVADYEKWYNKIPNFRELLSFFKLESNALYLLRGLDKTLEKSQEEILSSIGMITQVALPSLEGALKQEWAASALRQLFGEPKEWLLGARSVALDLKSKELFAKEQLLLVAEEIESQLTEIIGIFAQAQLAVVRKLAEEEARIIESASVKASINAKPVHVVAREDARKLGGDAANASRDATNESKVLRTQLGLLGNFFTEVLGPLGRQLGVAMRTVVRPDTLDSSEAIPVASPA